MPNDFRLSPTEAVIAVNGLEDLQRIVVHGFFFCVSRMAHHRQFRFHGNPECGIGR